MANRFNEIVRLAQDTFDRVSSSPDARACASIELWNLM